MLNPFKCYVHSLWKSEITTLDQYTNNIRNQDNTAKFLVIRPIKFNTETQVSLIGQVKYFI